MSTRRERAAKRKASKVNRATVGPKVLKQAPFVPKVIDRTEAEEGVGVVIVAPVSPNPFKKS